MHRRVIGILLIMGAILLPLDVYSETEERRVEEEKRKVFDRLSDFNIINHQRFLIEYGGWLNYRYIDLKNSDNDNSVTDSFDSSFSIDSRAWIKLTLKPLEDADNDNRHFVYVRLKNLYAQRFGDSSVERYDNDGPHLDYAFTMLDFTPYRIEAGRRYFFVGRGLTYGDVNDGIQFNYFRPGWNMAGFVSHTLPHEDNIDASVPGFDKESDRTFYGVGAGYAGIKNHVLYSYAVVQQDDSDERPNDLTQDYDYNSEYYSVGAQGKIFKRLTYWIELIKEYGESRIAGSNAKADVDAWAGIFGLERQWNSLVEPKLTFEYAFGSGDSSRSDVTDTVGGNTAGDDNNFLYFGYMPTGIALSPRLSNLHMLKLGFEVKPFAQLKKAKDLTVTLEYFYFQKHRSAGGISDPEASVANRDIGQEVDITIDWQLLSDLNLGVEYGHFIPGEAYLDGVDDSEDYFSVSLTHTF